MAYENAVSALGKVLEFHPECVEPHMGSHYVAALPVKADTGAQPWGVPPAQPHSSLQEGLRLRVRALVLPRVWAPTPGATVGGCFIRVV